MQLSGFGTQLLASAIKLWVRQISGEMGFSRQQVIKALQYALDPPTISGGLQNLICNESVGEVNYRFLECLFLHLNRVLSNSRVNFCDPQSLSSAWSFVIQSVLVDSNLPLPPQDPQQTASSANLLTLSLITDTRDIFAGFELNVTDLESVGRQSSSDEVFQSAIGALGSSQQSLACANNNSKRTSFLIFGGQASSRRNSIQKQSPLKSIPRVPPKQQQPSLTNNRPFNSLTNISFNSNSTTTFITPSTALPTNSSSNRRCHSLPLNVRDFEKIYAATRQLASVHLYL